MDKWKYYVLFSKLDQEKKEEMIKLLTQSFQRNKSEKLKLILKKFHENSKVGGVRDRFLRRILYSKTGRYIESF